MCHLQKPAAERVCASISGGSCLADDTQLQKRYIWVVLRVCLLCSLRCQLWEEHKVPVTAHGSYLRLLDWISSHGIRWMCWEGTEVFCLTFFVYSLILLKVGIFCWEGKVKMSWSWFPSVLFCWRLADQHFRSQITHSSLAYGATSFQSFFPLPFLKYFSILQYSALKETFQNT